MRLTATALLTVSFSAVLMLTSCNSAPKPKVEAPPSVAFQSNPDTVAPVTPSVTIAPKLAEVQNKVQTVFKGAAVLHPNHNPNFFTGDFNGDASQDLALILKPVDLENMNRLNAPWLVRAPRSNLSTKLRLQIQKDETVLAVIHGYGTNDWRDPDATQTFVLKNVVGDDLKIQTGKEFVEMNSGRKLPRPQGDLIGETIDGTRGFLYYASSNYSWYDPKTYKGEDVPGPFHRARMK
ncbi:MAG TPA: hypothetical protein VHS05_06315 [Pyrinomonadaceae bacterium]|jgi:hypothetical protein|nr:hypothetical protein [Pyrinomonadaceae bacterium]